MSSPAVSDGRWPALSRLVSLGRMIKFSHSIFALPFALSAVVLASVEHRIELRQVLWIVVAMVMARSAAMGFNRLADAEIDARNPRTAGRELPRGVLSPAEVRWFVALASMGFMAAAWMLNPLCFWLSPVALAIVFGYSYTKRITRLSHLVLGMGLGIAPVGAWLAVTGEFALVPTTLALAVMMWVAGFDTIYACQDMEFDRSEGLHSLPSEVGVPRALWLSRGFHAVSAALLLSIYWQVELHPFYLVGVSCIAALLVYEHSLVRADDLSRVDAAFFATNAWISMGFLIVTLFSRVLA